MSSKSMATKLEQLSFIYYSINIIIDILIDKNIYNYKKKFPINMNPPTLHLYSIRCLSKSQPITAGQYLMSVVGDKKLNFFLTVSWLYFNAL